jgi:hypothetical protein
MIGMIGFNKYLLVQALGICFALIRDQDQRTTQIAIGE